MKKFILPVVLTVILISSNMSLACCPVKNVNSPKVEVSKDCGCKCKKKNCFCKKILSKIKKSKSKSK